jgi:hypothetical protein
MKRFGTLALALLLIAMLLPLGCKKEGEPAQNASTSPTVLAKTATVNGIETPNYYAWYYHVQKDGTAMLDCFVTVTGLVIPEKVDGYTVTALARNAFRDDEFQGEITIPDCLTEIEGNPFNTSGYFTISVSASHPTLEIKNGALFDKRESRLICAFTSDEDPIPEGTRIIEDHAFRNVAVGEVHIPASVEKIGQNPFGYRQTQQMANLFSKITVAEDNPYFKVHDGALFDEREHRLISVSRADMRDMFSADTIRWEYMIPDGTKKIDDLAFGHVTLYAVTIPATVEEIGINPFTGTWEVRLASGNLRFTITGGVLYDTVEKRVICREHNKDAAPAEIITIPEDAEIIGDRALFKAKCNLTLPDSVREIGENGICNNYEYDANTAPVIHIPKTVRRIGMYAIRGYRIEGGRLELNGGVELGTRAFSDTFGLTEVAIGDGGAIVHGGAFAVGSSEAEKPLQRISFGTGETVIGRYAFNCCKRLESVDFSEGLALIGDQAFYECRNLKELKLPKSLFWAYEGSLLNDGYDVERERYGRISHQRFDVCSMELIVYHGSFAEQLAQNFDPQQTFDGRLKYRYAD